MSEEREASPRSEPPPGEGFRAGAVALVGRPNAGKSTLMNHLLAEKVAIVSDKPQTTRSQLVGILTEGRGQIVFYDTPGIHKPLHQLNRQMVREALSALEAVDVICLLVDASKPFGKGDAYLLELLGKCRSPRLVLLNKLDLVRKESLLPLMARYGEGGQFEEIVPVSALTGEGCDLLLELLFDRLPEGAPLFDPELLTIHPERFLVAERIREKVLELTAEEIPFSTAVVIDRWEEEGRLLRLWATILVERPSQKKIVVGSRGGMVKAIGSAARRDLEAYLERTIYLSLHVKVAPRWREDRRVLARLERERQGG